MWLNGKNITKLRFTELIDSLLNEINVTTLRHLIVENSRENVYIPFLLYKNKLEKKEYIKCPSCNSTHYYHNEKNFICPICGKETFKFVDFRKCRTATTYSSSRFSIKEKIFDSGLISKSSEYIERKYIYYFKYYFDGNINLSFGEYERYYGCGFYKSISDFSYINSDYFFSTKKVYDFSRYGSNLDFVYYSKIERFLKKTSNCKSLFPGLIEEQKRKNAIYKAKKISHPFFETLEKQTKKVVLFNNFVLTSESNDFLNIKYKYFKLAFDKKIYIYDLPFIIKLGHLELIKNLDLTKINILKSICDIFPFDLFSSFKLLTYLIDTRVDYKTYYDYLKIEKQLFDFKIIKKIIYFPKDINLAHDIFSKKLTDYKNFLKDLSFSKIEDLAKFYSFEKKVLDYDLYIPHNYMEIKEQALHLRQCLVSSDYCERVLNGECLLLFCNKKGSVEKGLYTIELLPNGCINQFRGFCNKKIDNSTLEKKVSNLLKKFCNNLEIVDNKFRSFT